MLAAVCLSLSLELGARLPGQASFFLVGMWGVMSVPLGGKKALPVVTQSQLLHSGSVRTEVTVPGPSAPESSAYWLDPY